MFYKFIVEKIILLVLNIGLIYVNFLKNAYILVIVCKDLTIFLYATLIEQFHVTMKLKLCY